MLLTPSFCYRPPGVLSHVLAPLSVLYAAGVQTRFWFTRHVQKASVPVICIGNIVSGGAGKTPVALAIARFLQNQGKEVHFVSRGYGGSIEGPTLVEPMRHSFKEVGDEPLLLAAQAPTWVAKDRWRGIESAEKAGAEIIVLDDGLQNPSFAKTLSLLVIDGQQGIGNGHVLPAGPLRESLNRCLRRVDGVILIGKDQWDLLPRLHISSKPVIRAEFCPSAESLVLLKETPMVAFAGLGYPEKFFATLYRIGSVLENHAFSDHYPYTVRDLEPLIQQAQASQANLVTTRKDWLRVPLDMRSYITVLDGEIVFDLFSQKNLETLLTQVVK